MELVGATLPRKPRAILLDVYGTIVTGCAGGEPARFGDGLGHCEEARRLLDSELKKSSFPADATIFAREVDSVIVRTREDAMRASIEPEIDIEDVVSRVLGREERPRARLVSVLLEAWRNPCAPMPGAAAFISRRSRDGTRLGIASNAQFYTPLLIEALFGLPPEDLGFEAELCAYSFERLRAKPDADLFIRAAAPLLESGLVAGEILVIGNSWRNDIAPARALGFMTTLFAGDARSYSPGRAIDPETRPDSVLMDYDQFESIVPT